MLFAPILVSALLVLVIYAMPALGIETALSSTDSVLGMESVAAAPTTALGAGTVLDAVEATLGEIYTEVSPSVVNIQVLGSAATLPDENPEIPGLPFDPSIPQGGLGSGFVWDRDGHIVTNNHVVEGAAKIQVTFSDDTAVPAEVVGTDPNSDLAVIKVDLPAERLEPVEVADSTDVRVGQLAVAIGNPFGLEGTMTVGFVSALGRSLPVASSNLMAPSYTIPDIIQTDAPINPGNSGGVLVNDEGQLIGVPTAIESPVQANAGIGFAVPSVIVQKVVPVLIRDGHYEHPWLGISGTTLSSQLAEAMDFEPEQRGALVIEVVPDGPADEAGLRGSERQIDLDGQAARVGGDVIVAVEGQPVDEFDDLVTYLIRSGNVGEQVDLTILRDGREETVAVRLAARPKEEVAAAPASPLPVTGAWLGIQGLTLTPEIAEAMDLSTEQQGVLVAEVVGSSPADQAGLRGGDQVIEIDGQPLQVGGDIIVAADNQPIASFEDLRSWVQQAEPGQEATLTLLRDGEEITVEVTLSERPISVP